MKYDIECRYYKLVLPNALRDDDDDNICYNNIILIIYGNFVRIILTKGYVVEWYRENNLETTSNKQNEEWNWNYI